MATKVLFLHSGGDWIRGSENALVNLLRGIDRRKIMPALCTGNEKLESVARAENIETIFCPMPEVMIDGLHVRLQFLRYAKLFRRLIAYVKQNEIGAVYCNGGSTCQLGYYVGKAAGIPVICHVHSPYNRRYILLYRIHRADRVIFVSSAIRNGHLKKQSFRARHSVVHNGVDLQRFRPPSARDLKWRDRFGLHRDSVVFGQVSSLIHRKGVDVLLRSFHIVRNQCPEARLVLIGDGPQSTEYIAMARDLGIEGSVIFAGNQRDPVPFYQNVLDVNVLASRSDAFPLSLLEASGCGLPNIGANVDGIGESVFDGETGFLFESGNHEALADKMRALVADTELRRRLGEAGRATAEQKFCLQLYCESVQRIILDELAGGSIRKTDTSAEAVAWPESEASESTGGA